MKEKLTQQSCMLYGSHRSVTEKPHHVGDNPMAVGNAIPEPVKEREWPSHYRAGSTIGIRSESIRKHVSLVTSKSLC